MQRKSLKICRPGFLCVVYVGAEDMLALPICVVSDAPNIASQTSVRLQPPWLWTSVRSNSTPPQYVNGHLNWLDGLGDVRDPPPHAGLIGSFGYPLVPFPPMGIEPILNHFASCGTHSGNAPHRRWPRVPAHPKTQPPPVPPRAGARSSPAAVPFLLCSATRRRRGSYVYWPRSVPHNRDHQDPPSRPVFFRRS